MSNSRENALYEIVNIFYENKDWANVAFELYLKKLELDIIDHMNEYGYPRLKNPEMYWEIGKLINSFIIRRINDSKKARGKEISASIQSKVISKLTIIMGDLSGRGNEKLFQSKRSMRSMIDLSMLVSSELIDANISWSGYAEFTQSKYIKELSQSKRDMIFKTLQEISSKNKGKKIRKDDLRFIIKKIDEKNYKTISVRDIKNWLKEVNPNLNL